MQIFEILLGPLAASVVLALVARHMHLPLAVALVLGGMVLALVPGLPSLTLDPQLALVLFLPPLLQAREVARGNCTVGLSEISA